MTMTKDEAARRTKLIRAKKAKGSGKPKVAKPFTIYAGDVYRYKRKVAFDDVQSGKALYIAFWDFSPEDPSTYAIVVRRQNREDVLP